MDTDERDTMGSTKITGLSPLNVRALSETTNGVELTATTATFPGLTPTEARRRVEAVIATLPGRGHPRASLHAVRRRLIALEDAAKRGNATDDRIARQTERADTALAALHNAINHDQRLAAAQALESAACQLRRALKAQS